MHHWQDLATSAQATQIQAGEGLEGSRWRTHDITRKHRVSEFDEHGLILLCACQKRKKSIQASQHKPGRYRNQAQSKLRVSSNSELNVCASPTVGGSELHPTPFRVQTKEKVRKTQKGGYRCEEKKAARLNAASSRTSSEVK
jgi:hypothetical protein